ncbi:MAG TPA: hypothetical protein VF173_11480 [Thermoanaerobaculia bacterium]|nr:hypothetical protein [Thermoanaerobaculia bacterium]
MRRASVILLLLAITLGLSAGPHPCHAAAATAAAGHASCHEARPAPQTPKGHDCCDPMKEGKGGHALCDQACQGSALIGATPALLEVQSFEELEASAVDRPTALLVLSIDHVPLA